VTVVVAIAVVMASLARFFELMPPVFGLPAVLTVPADSLFQILFGLVNFSLALFVAVVGVCLWRAAQQQQPEHRSSKQSGLSGILEHSGSLSTEIIVPLTGPSC
jgi:small-conductance mechanosensitive channel